MCDETFLVLEYYVFCFHRSLDDPDKANTNESNDVNDKTKEEKVDQEDAWLFSVVASQPSTGLMTYSTCLDIENQSGFDETEINPGVKIEMVGIDGKVLNGNETIETKL